MTDVGPALRAAVIANAAISSELSQWQGAPAVFTRLPLPEDASFPCVAIPFEASTLDQDALTSQRTVIVRDIMVYGNIAAPGTDEDQTRVVDDIARELRTMFHRNKAALVNTSYHVIDIVVNGPRPAPVDDDKTVGRMVTLTLRIQDGS